MPYIKSNALFTRPSDPSPSYRQDANGTKDASGNYTILRSYIAVSTAKSLSLAQIDDPVETIVVDKWETVSDSWMEPFNRDFNVDPSNPARMWVAGNRHQGMVNCAFFDGHAKALKPDTIRSSVDLTGCRLMYRYPYLTKGPTITSPTMGTPQPTANVCAKPNFVYAKRQPMRNAVSLIVISAALVVSLKAGTSAHSARHDARKRKMVAYDAKDRRYYSVSWAKAHAMHDRGGDPLTVVPMASLPPDAKMSRAMHGKM